MTDFINKMISVILVFLMLVICPLNFDYQNDLATGKRLILNDIENFLDKISDKKSISQFDLDDFYIKLNSHGLVIDADVRILRAIPEALETTYICVYNLGDPKEISTIQLENGEMDALDDLVPGDIIQVDVKEITTSSARKIGFFIMGYDSGNYRQSMACYIGH